MISPSQDFNGWLHLLSIPENGRVGLVGDIPEHVRNAVESFGADPETWNATDSTYDAVIVYPGTAIPAADQIKEALTESGNIWIWNASRSVENDIEAADFRTRRFVALPSTERPRLTFEPNAGVKNVRASLAIHPTNSFRTRFAKAIYSRLAGLMSTARIGPSVALLATPKRIAAPDGMVSSAIPESNLDEHSTVIAASPGKGFKCVIATSGADGKFKLFNKIADTPTHGESLQNEASILSNLTDDLGHLNFTIPNIVGQSSNSQFTHLTLAPLEGRKLNFSDPLPHSLVRSMGSLFASTSTNNSENLATVTRRISERSGSNPLIDHACTDVANQLEGTELPLGLAHRDFVFWNILEQDGRNGLIDWEWAEKNHIPFQDVFHYFVHGAVNALGISPTQAMAILQETEAVTSMALFAESALVSPTLIKPMFTLYLCDWLGIQHGLGLSDAPQTNAYRELLSDVVDGKISIQ